MEHYLLEAALLMLAAYLLGATLGCVLRRAISPEVNATAPVKATIAAASADTNAAAASIRDAPEPVQPRIETMAHPTPPKETKVAESARFERALTSAPAGTAAGLAAATVAATTSTTGPEPRLPAASSGTGTSAGASTTATPADDLRKIRGVDTETANHLNLLGYTSFSQISDWRSHDMARIRKALGDKRASKGGWIEQAKILADGKQTRHLRRHAEGTPESPWALTAAAATAPAADVASAPATAEAPPPIAAPAAPPATPDPGPQELGLIEGVDGNAARLLCENGVTTYRQIADWTAADVERLETLLGERGRVSRQNWTEQAKVLADGKDTAFIRRMRSEPMLISAPIGGLPSPQPLPAAASQSENLKYIKGVDDSAERILHSEGIHRFAQIASWKSTDVHKVDILLGEPGRVYGQNWVEQAKILADGKQTKYLKRQMNAPNPVPRPGSFTAAGVLGIAALKGAPQVPPPAAPGLAKPAAATPPPPPEFTPPASAATASEADTEPLEPETEPLQPAAATEQAPRRARLADAIRQNAANMEATAGAPASGVAGMGSVHSQLLSKAGAVQPSTVDDLQKIRGIGVLIEKKLNVMGVYSYDQIANWSAGDIHRVSSALDFKGRIEREDWVQQARILASGGQTEFSRRLT